MVCTKCKQPLMERYNGQLFCHKCGTTNQGQRLSITKENEELYMLSELCFLRHLSPAKGPLEVPRDLLGDAISYCKLAAGTGHPKAIFRMGFFYEFYFKEKLSETERVQTAFQHYWKLCGSSTTQSLGQIITPDAKPRSINGENEWQLLKRQAAMRILELMSIVPWAFSGGVDNRYQKARRYLLDAYKSDAFSETSKRSRNRVEEIARMLSGCYSKERPPLMGLFHIKSSELQELLTLRADAKAGRRHDMSKMCEDLLFHYLRCDRDGALGKQRDFVRIRYAEYPSEGLGGEDYLYFLFFNKSAKHAYLGGSRLRRIESEVLDDKTELLDFISGSARKQLLLFEEDVFYTRKVLKGKFSDLITDICEEGI